MMTPRPASTSLITSATPSKIVVRSRVSAVTFGSHAISKRDMPRWRNIALIVRRRWPSDHSGNATAMLASAFRRTRSKTYHAARPRRRPRKRPVRSGIRRPAAVMRTTAR